MIFLIEINHPITACKRHNPAAGATQGYDRLHAARYVKGHNKVTILPKRYNQ